MFVFGMFEKARVCVADDFELCEKVMMMKMKTRNELLQFSFGDMLTSPNKGQGRGAIEGFY